MTLIDLFGICDILGNPETCFMSVPRNLDETFFYFFLLAALGKEVPVILSSTIST